MNRIFFLLLAVLVLSSCQSFRSVVEEPRVSLNSVSIAGISFSGVDLVVNVDVENPNNFSIPMPNIDWELFVNTASFVQGSLPNDKSIRRRATATLALPVSFTYEGLFRSFMSLIETKEAAYDIALGITFPIPLLTDKVFNLAYSGVLPLPQLPVLSPGQVRISRVDFTGIEITSGVNVENPNAFPIPFPKLDWDYSVNGIPVIRSNFAGAGDIAAGAAGAALITVSMAYADIFRAVETARNAGEARSNLLLGFNPGDIGFPLAALDNNRGVQSILNIPGTIPILQMPVLSFQGITRRALGRTMEFTLNWEVDNRNNFAWDIAEFNYNFRVNNNQWAQGLMENPPRVRAGGRTLIPLNVTISAPAIVAELVTILNQGFAVDFTSTGNMSFLPDFPGLERINIPMDLSGSTRIR